MSLQVLAFPQAELGALIQAISGMQTIWDGDPEAFDTPQEQCTAFGEPPRGFIALTMVSSTTQGVDDQFDAFDPVAQSNAHTQVGWRNVVVQAMLHSSNEVPAFNVAELIRTRLRRPSSSAALTAVGLAFVEAGACVEFDKSDANGRAIYYSTMDLKFNRVVVEQTDDGQPNDGGWIDTVNVNTGGIPSGGQFSS